jgi:Helix-loop-helix DNA-binding domain
LCFSFDSTKSTKGASKLRRDLINSEIANLRDLLPLPPSTRQRLSQLQLMALVCVYVRKANYFTQGMYMYKLLDAAQKPLSIIRVIEPLITMQLHTLNANQTVRGAAPADVGCFASQRNHSSLRARTPSSTDECVSRERCAHVRRISIFTRSLMQICCLEFQVFAIHNCFFTTQ